MPSRAGLPTRYAIRIDRVAPRFHHLPFEVQGLLRLCDGTRPRTSLRRDSALPPRTFERVLERLERLGYVAPVTPPDDRQDGRTRVLDWATALMPPSLPAAPTSAAPLEVLFEQQPLGEFSLDEEAFFSRSIDHLLEPEERPNRRPS